MAKKQPPKRPHAPSIDAMVDDVRGALIDTLAALEQYRRYSSAKDPKARERLANMLLEQRLPLSRASSQLSDLWMCIV